jgi:hypothetical protein
MALKDAIGVLLLIDLVAGSVSAQGLAQAAQKAKEQSEATAGSGTTVTKLSTSALDGDLEELLLTNDLLQLYAQARESIGREFYRDVNLYNRVEDAMRKVTRQREAYKVYEAEPKLKAAFEFNGLTAASFMDLFLTISRAQSRGYTGYGARPPASMTPLQSSNTAFMTQHASELTALENRLSRNRAWQFVRPPMTRVRY